MQGILKAKHLKWRALGEFGEDEKGGINMRTLLHYYSASSGNSLPKFWDYLTVPLLGP